VEGQKSGYIFQGRTIPAELNGTEFRLGTFTHVNFPIITAHPQFHAYLDVDVTFEDDQTKIYLPRLRFHHIETPNVGDHQEDIVELPEFDEERTVKVGDQEYVARITGFAQEGVRHVRQFTSPERRSNQASIKALLAPIGTANSYISHVQARGHASKGQADEYVEVLNGGAEPADISGWTVRSDASGHSFTFPDGSTIQSGHRIRVYTNEAHSAYGGYSYRIERPVWNNDGDIAFLEDADGNMVSVFPYGG